jgi:predicted dehydrogenase
MKEVRLGVVGVGGMGKNHASSVWDGKIKGCRLAAVCDTDPARLEPFKGQVQGFTDFGSMLKAGAVDAVLIATPHYAHTTLGIAALKVGLHVLVEKPISVHKADAARLIAAHRRRGQVFAAMFNQRTDPHYTKVKAMIEGGDLGPLTRVNWIITSWFRTEYYYASGGWRATWAGEGGGVLLNQCPHQLDLLQWLCGMPKRVMGFCHFGKRHNIEVEDEVTAYLEYPNGATGVFITSTGEAPGTNRLEIVGDNGKLVIEGDHILFVKNEISTRKFCRTSKESFAKPKTVTEEIKVEGHGPQHQGILQNFTDAILDGAPLIAPAREGIRSVELGNAMLYSAWTGRPVDLPLDAGAYERQLKQRIRTSRYVKKTVRAAGPQDLSKSFK